MVGTLDGSTYAAKFNSHGNMLWDSKLNGKDGISIVPSMDEGFIVLGTQTPPPWSDPDCEGHGCQPPNPYDNDLYIAKIDEGGGLLWENTGQIRNTHPSVMYPLYSGDYVVIGWQNGSHTTFASAYKIDRNGIMQWSWFKEVFYSEFELLSAHVSNDQLSQVSPTYRTSMGVGIEDAILLPNGNFVLVGVAAWFVPIDLQRQIGRYKRDILIAQADSSGLTPHVFSTIDDQFLNSICPGVDNGFMATGVERLSILSDQESSPGTPPNLLVVNMSAAIDTIWTKIYSQMGSGRSIRKKSNNEFIITGDVNDDIFLLSIDNLGTINSDAGTYPQDIVPTQAHRLGSNTSISEIQPLAYRLSQNFPNPFNSQTQIAYQIPEITFVTITIYDLLGQLVRRGLVINK